MSIAGVMFIASIDFTWNDRRPHPDIRERVEGKEQAERSSQNQH